MSDPSHDSGAPEMSPSPDEEAPLVRHVREGAGGQGVTDGATAASEPPGEDGEHVASEHAFTPSRRRDVGPDTEPPRRPVRLPATDTETLLFFDDDDDDRELLLVLPSAPLPDLGSGVLASAVHALETLDPLVQEGAIDRPLAGVRLLPGLFPLAPITFGAFGLFSLGLAASLWFSAHYATAYLFAFAIIHTLFIAHVWTYHLAYRTRRRFMALRQAFFLVVVVTFLGWIVLDIIESPPGLASLKARISNAYARPLWVALVADVTAAAAIASHWLFLGRGHREVSLETGRVRRRVGSPAKVASRSGERLDAMESDPSEGGGA